MSVALAIIRKLEADGFLKIVVRECRACGSAFALTPPRRCTECGSTRGYARRKLA
ncbi:MAG TPA: hypothetical protein VKQ71_08505 [Acidimicrobiales bacterium]|nr:hypothetical protein [Acidimicrobiales bacterium]